MIIFYFTLLWSDPYAARLFINYNATIFTLLNYMLVCLFRPNSNLLSVFRSTFFSSFCLFDSFTASALGVQVEDPKIVASRRFSKQLRKYGVCLKIFCHLNTCNYNIITSNTVRCIEHYCTHWWSCTFTESPILYFIGSTSPRYWGGRRSL